MKSALVILATGFEEMEAVISIDVLRRAGITVVIAGLDGTNPVTGSRKIVVLPDASLDKVDQNDYDVVILPGGGEGSDKLAASKLVKNILKRQEDRRGLIAAICAAPIALKSHQICPLKKLTSHPSKSNELKDCYKYSEERVVTDGNLITSRGPGTAFEFAFSIVEYLCGKDKVEEISKPMIIR